MALYNQRRLTRRGVGVVEHWHVVGRGGRVLACRGVGVVENLIKMYYR